MEKNLKVIQKKLLEIDVKKLPRMTGSQMMLAAEKITSEIEDRAARRARGELTPEDDILEVTEWL